MRRSNKKREVSNGFPFSVFYRRSAIDPFLNFIVNFRAAQGFYDCRKGLVFLSAPMVDG